MAEDWDDIQASNTTYFPLVGGKPAPDLTRTPSFWGKLLGWLKSGWPADMNAGGKKLLNLGQDDWAAPTLVNSWVTYDAAQSDPGYFKDTCGTVHLRGVFKSGTNNATIFTLPSGYRPPKFGCFAGFCTDGGGTYKTCLIGVSGTGAVIAYGVGSGFNFQVSVDGISFRTT